MPYCAVYLDLVLEYILVNVSDDSFFYVWHNCPSVLKCSCLNYIHSFEVLKTI